MEPRFLYCGYGKYKGARIAYVWCRDKCKHAKSCPHLKGYEDQINQDSANPKIEEEV
jgi:uncharacterized Fe-S cluster protein YjdI